MSVYELSTELLSAGLQDLPVPSQDPGPKTKSSKYPSNLAYEIPKICLFDFAIPMSLIKHENGYIQVQSITTHWPTHKMQLRTEKEGPAAPANHLAARSACQR